MNFRAVYCETVVVIMCLVFVKEIVTAGRTVENGEGSTKSSSSSDPVPRSGSEIGSSHGTRPSEKSDSSTKRGLDSSMAYPQGYFPPYQSNEMHSSVTPSYNRDYDQEMTKKQVYFETPMATGPVFITQKPSMHRPFVPNMRPSLPSNYGYFASSLGNSYPSGQGTFSNNDRQFSNPTPDIPYSDLTSYRPTQNVQPVADYPENSYPSYVYGYDPRKNYPIHTPSYQSSYQPSYETHRGQNGIEYENRYPGIHREYNNPANSPQSHTFVSYEPEGQPISDGHRYNSELPQVDGKPTVQYQLQVLRVLEEQKRRLLQEINAQTQGTPSYHPSTPGTVQRRMTPQFSISPVSIPTRDYFLSERGVSPNFQSFGHGRGDGAFLTEPANQQPIMATSIPYLVGDRSQFPLTDPQRRRFDVRNSYLMPKNKRDMEVVASTCGEAVIPGQDGNIVPCSSMNPLADKPFGQGPFWDYFELESSKHLIYRQDVMPPVFPPIDLPPILPDDLPPCADVTTCYESTGMDGMDNNGNVRPEITGLPSEENGDAWVDHKPTQQFNTSCGNTSKPNDQTEELKTTTTTTISPSTASTTTEDATSVGSTSESSGYGTGDDTDTVKDEPVIVDKTENIAFPDSLDEEDEKTDEDIFNEAILQINPRKARE